MPTGTHRPPRSGPRSSQRAISGGLDESLIGPSGEPLGGAEVISLVDGAHEVPLPEDAHAVVSVALPPGFEGTVRWQTDRRVADVTDRGAPQRLEVGDEVDGVIDPLDLVDVYEVDLDAGDEIVVTAEGPNAADPWLTLTRPGESWLDAEYAEETAGGLYDLGSVGELEAEVDGTHRVYVESGDGFATFYRLRIDPAPA